MRKKDKKGFAEPKSVLFLLKYVRKYTPGYLALELLLVIGNSVWDIIIGNAVCKIPVRRIRKRSGLPTGCWRSLFA
ncbi:MAG: hypothetical protein V8R94_03795 [Lachnospiraceae bacterium]